MKQELIDVCKSIKEMIDENKYKESEAEIVKMIEMYPHSAIPHNLMGILLEKENNHILAMKHFRAAYALDPTYTPARYNMNKYGDFYQTGKCAYCEEDCEIEKDILEYS